jgi:glycosyltransferase involved in cell wall biosynthesis
VAISIIIPTFDNVEFLDELFESILKNQPSIPYEVMIGIDGCEKTKEYFSSRRYQDNFFFYYFVKNEGPYKIKNTLAEVSNYENIFFFDSDDLMVENTIEKINELLDKYECVKPKFNNFKDPKGNRNFDNIPGQYGEGVFAIHKKLFLSMNGFEGWRCAADSDFMGRIYKTGRKVGLTQDILFHRRIHNKSLTRREDTGYASELRGKYSRMSKSKSTFGPLSVLSKNDYQILDVETYEWSKPISVIENEKIDEAKELKKKRHELLDKLFDNSPKDLKTKQVRTIDYNKVNRNTNFQTHSNMKDALKKAKLENIRKNSKR